GEVMREEMHGELSPTQLDMVLNLPSETGLYYMYDKDGEIIYPGSSRDIKKKVNQHFTQQGTLARALQKETKRVAFEPPGSESLAQLKEYGETKEIRPKYRNGPEKKLFTHTLDFEGPDKAILNQARGKFLEGKKMGFKGHASAKAFLEKICQEFDLCGSMDKKGGFGTWPNERSLGEKLQSVLDKYSIQGKDVVILDRGRENGERSFIRIMDGKLQGYGYVELNFQIDSNAILDAIMTPMPSDDNTRFIIESHLRKAKSPKIVPLNAKP